MPSGATPLRATMRRTAPIGWSASLTGPDLCSRSTGETRNGGGPGVTHGSRFTLKRADFTRLETAARALGSSAFRAMLALTYVAFARLYDRSDIVLGSNWRTAPTPAQSRRLECWRDRCRCL